MTYGFDELNQIIKDVLSEMTIGEVAKKHFMSEKSVRRLLHDNGYTYDKKQKLWYNNALQKQAIWIMNNCDVEEEIDWLSRDRYYDRYKDPYPSEYEHETESIDIHKGIVEELIQISERFGCSSEEELVELILLRFLDKNRKLDLSTLFRQKAFKELGYDEHEIKILMQHPNKDYDGSALLEDEMLCEDDTSQVAIQLKKYYRKFLKEKNIDTSDMKKVMAEEDMNELIYLQLKYRELTGGKIVNVRDIME